MERQWRYFLVLVWIGYTIFCGVHIFSSGFLLTRVVQKERTSCVSFPDACPANETHCTSGMRINQYLNNVNLSDSICLPKKSRVILLVIDALKYDFGIYDPGLRKPLAYQNRMPIFSEMLQKHPRRSRMLKFMADPPTTTMQRLKGLTTGSLPTFIDIGSNFASPEINEDNIIDQIVGRNMTAVFLGDSTWTDLFPGRFTREYSYPSFNIFDLDTVDRRIEKHLPDELRENDWDLLVAHFLGVDHCGHKHGPLHREMSRKLGEMDAVVRRVIDEMANDTMLLVIGDHGMTSNGDHGGDSADELTSLIFAYAKGNDLIMNGNGNEMQQIDLVPTLAAIFGIPIPYSNLGSIRMDLLPEVEKVPRMETLLLHMWQNAKQIQRYFQHYASTNLGTFRPDHIDDLENKFLVLSHRVNSIYSEAAFVNFAKDLQGHLRGVLVACHEIWVRFDAESMTNGLLIAILTVFGCFLLFHNLKIRQLERLFSTSIVTFIYASNVICIVSIVALKWISANTINSVMLYMAAFNILILGLFIIQHWSNIVENWNEIGKFSNTITRIVYLVLVIIFFSNSFIIQEPKILTYILTGMLLHVLFELKRAFLPDGKRQIKLLTIFSSVPMQLIGLATIAIFCLRIAHMFFRCREEHGNCLEFVGMGNPSNGVGGKSQAVARRKLDLIAVVAVALFATLTRIYLRSCGNLSGYSWNTILARYGPTLAAVCTSGYFLLSPKNGKTSGIPQLHIDAMAWIVGGIFLMQMLILVFRPLMIYVVPQGMVDDTVNTGRLIPDLYRRLKTIYGEDRENGERNKIPIICGLGTVYSSTMVSYFVIFTILMALLLGAKAATGLLVTMLVAAVFIILTGVLRYQTAKSLESCLQPTFATLVVWLLLIHFTFYTTSHQTTLSQIDWHPAFVGRTAYHDHSNIISASLVIISTFCGAVLLGTIFPLVTLAPFFIYSALPNLATYHRDMAPERRPERLKTSNNVEYRKVNISRADDEVTGEETTMNVVEYDITKGELNLFENEALFIGAIFKSACQLMALQGLRIFCSMLACTIHCRHLMVWKIFAPRFIYEGISTYVLLGAILFSYLMLIRIHRAVVNLIVKFTKFN